MDSAVKGIVLTTKNTMTVRDFGEPLYQTVGEAVGGWIEIVHPAALPEPYVMIVNEEGLLISLDVNKVASMLYGAAIHGQTIRGDVVIMKEGWTDDGPDVVGLEDVDITVLRGLFNRAGVKEE